MLVPPCTRKINYVTNASMLGVLLNRKTLNFLKYIFRVMKETDMSLWPPLPFYLKINVDCFYALISAINCEIARFFSRLAVLLPLHNKTEYLIE